VRKHCSWIAALRAIGLEIARGSIRFIIKSFVFSVVSSFLGKTELFLGGKFLFGKTGLSKASYMAEKDNKDESYFSSVTVRA
jgi:hypothetical protein